MRKKEPRLRRNLGPGGHFHQGCNRIIAYTIEKIKQIVHFFTNFLNLLLFDIFVFGAAIASAHWFFARVYANAFVFADLAHQAVSGPLRSVHRLKDTDLAGFSEKQ